MCVSSTEWASGSRTGRVKEKNVDCCTTASSIPAKWQCSTIDTGVDACCPKKSIRISHILPARQLRAMIIRGDANSKLNLTEVKGSDVLASSLCRRYPR